MSEILKETLNSDGVPLLVYKNFGYIKTRCNIGGEIFWRCVNRKCRSYMTTEGFLWVNNKALTLFLIILLSWLWSDIISFNNSYCVRLFSGQPGKRFIVDSDLNHNHNPNDEKIKPPEPLQHPPKRKYDEGETEPRKILAARIEPGLCSTSMFKEKRGILKSWSFARRKNDTSVSQINIRFIWAAGKITGMIS